MKVTGRELLAVIIGGMLGTGLRVVIDTLLPHSDREFPLSTLIINVAGSFALGVLVARVWPGAPAWLRAGLGAGLLGSFTTFSALAVALVSLGPTSLAALYLGLSLLFGPAAAFLGLRLGRRAPIDLVNE